MAPGDLTFRFPESGVGVGLAAVGARLAAGREAVRLFLSETGSFEAGPRQYQTRIWSKPASTPAAAPSLEFAVPQLLAVRPDWDIVLLENAKYRLAISLARGGNNALDVVEEGGAFIPLRTAQSADDVDQQRFVRGWRGPGASTLTAVVNSNNVVVFRGRPDGSFDPPRSVAQGSQAVAVRQPGGFALFLKRTVDGPVRGKSISPGALWCVALDENFVARSGPVRLLEGRTVFEFDADRFGEWLAVLATTDKGISIALCEEKGGVVRVVQHVPVDLPEPFTSPTVLGSPEALRVAALLGADSPGARVLTGSARLGSA